MSGNYSDVTIKSLEDMIVAGYRVISQTPEDDVMKFMNEWLVRNGLHEQQNMRNFGFDVQVGKELSEQGNRGYEYWVTVPENTPESDGVIVKLVPADEYAVLRITDPFSDPFALIPKAWATLQQWVMSGEHKTTQYARRCWLEEVLQVDGVTYMDIYFPVGAGFGEPASTLINFHKGNLGPCRLIGKDIRCRMGHPEGNPIPAFWGTCFEDGSMTLIENHPDRIHTNATVGWMDGFDMNDNSFTYIVGGFLKPNASIPAGMVYRDIEESNYAVGTVKGREPDIFMNAHHLTEQALEQQNMQVFYEKYAEVEWYDERFCEDPEIKTIDLLIRIKK